MSDVVKGSCLCGAVSYQYTGTAKVFQYCHCSRCRKFTGSAYASNLIVEPEQFEWLSGEAKVGRYEVPGAKYFATSFCKQCGSSLPWLTNNKTAVVIPAGTLDDDPLEKPLHNIYFHDKAAWYEDAATLIKYDALPVKNKE